MALGTAPLGVLGRLVPDPLREESAQAQKHHDRYQRDHRALREQVQRLVKGSGKGKNVMPYADYIAQGIRGERGLAWSTPPLCLWSSLPVEVDDQARTGTLPVHGNIIAVDAETQVCAWHRLLDAPEAFGLVNGNLIEIIIPFELYWGIDVADARQIFHDRNFYGVPVSKSLALAMDRFDLATLLAQRITAEVTVTIGGQPAPLSPLVNKSKRSPGSGEWITLSALRSMVVTTLLGKAGIAQTANAVSVEDLPDGIDSDKAVQEAFDVLAAVFDRFALAFQAGTAITTPAVLTGIGVAAHRVMSWCKEVPLTRAEFLGLLDQVCWDRKPDYWDGVAGRATVDGSITFGGGAKDSGGRVADALLSPNSPAGRQIRGATTT
jgi:hypothetical protein